MNSPCRGFSTLLRAALGAQWAHLHPDIRARFTLAPGATRQRFTGNMSEIDRSFIGGLIARLIAFMRVLPAVRARDVPFEFNLAPAPVSASNAAVGWFKQRLYHFNDGDFEFRSIMSTARNGDLIEQFAYGLGMKIKLGAEGDHGERLTFRDDGYFLRLGARRLPIPRWLCVGRFTLTHHNIDREHFTVDIRIEHPLCGPLFYQAGSFTQAPAMSPARAATNVSARDKAYSAVRDTACW